MSKTTGGMTSERIAPEHTSRYEALRDHALRRDASFARHGLVVLLRQGVAAWMDAWSKMPSPPSPQPAKDESQRPCPLPDGSSAEVIRVLAAMTLGHVQEVYA